MRSSSFDFLGHVFHGAFGAPHGIEQSPDGKNRSDLGERNVPEERHVVSRPRAVNDEKHTQPEKRGSGRVRSLINPPAYAIARYCHRAIASRHKFLFFCLAVLAIASWLFFLLLFSTTLLNLFRLSYSRKLRRAHRYRARVRARLRGLGSRGLLLQCGRDGAFGVRFLFRFILEHSAKRSPIAGQSWRAAVWAAACS